MSISQQQSEPVSKKRSGPATVRVRQTLESHNFVAVKIRHLGVRVVVDTGAFSSCVSLSLIKRLKLESRVISVSQRKRLLGPMARQCTFLAPFI